MNKIIVIGMNDWMIIDSKKTIEQIKMVKGYELDLVDRDREKIKWKDLDDHNNRNTMFRAIVADRKLRIDKGQTMADRPNFCAVTINDNSIKRIEYYEGHDELKLVYDIRAKELIGLRLPRYMDKDVVSYNFDSNFNGLSTFCAMNNIDSEGTITKEFKQLYKKVHDEIMWKNVNKRGKYPSRISQTLKQHSCEFECMLMLAISSL